MDIYYTDAEISKDDFEGKKKDLIIKRMMYSIIDLMPENIYNSIFNIKILDPSSEDGYKHLSNYEQSHLKMTNRIKVVTTFRDVFEPHQSTDKPKRENTEFSVDVLIRTEDGKHYIGYYSFIHNRWETNEDDLADAEEKLKGKKFTWKYLE